MELTRVLWLAVVCAALAFGQAKQGHKGRGKIEGIQVHGHWVLEVRNPDGSVAQRKEFENSLATGAGNGGALLANILAGAANATNTVGPWVVEFFNATTVALAAAQSSGVYCQSGCARSLTVSSSTGQLILQGLTPQASAVTVIYSVATVLYSCQSSLDLQSCLQTANLYGPSFLTSANIGGAAGVTVQAGQDIFVTVTISFS
jgi:hypothetical protein